MVESMISVGIVWKKVLRYNGFTDAQRIKTRNWLNGTAGVEVASIQWEYDF